MKLTDIDLRQMLDFAPQHGKLLLGDDRMLLFRQDSFAVLRGLMYEQLGEELARAIFSQFGYQCGHGDFRALDGIYEWDTQEDRFGAGPAMHTWEGIVHVEPTFLEFDHKSQQFHMTGIWRNSYEAEIHLEKFGTASAPVCHSLTGYASGWCSAFLGSPTVAIETRCMGVGDERCEFEIRVPEKWGPEADSWKQSLATSNYSMVQELEAKVAELSTPVMEIWTDVLVLPLIGTIDSQRSAEIMEILLQSIVAHQSKCVIIDITGVKVIDRETADYMLKVIRAAEFLGTRCVLTGLNPAVAQTLVTIGADLQGMRALRTLKEGLKNCIDYLNSRPD